MSCDQKANSSIMTIYKHHCVNTLFPENNFYSQVNCFTRGNEEIYIILSVKEAQTSYLRMSTHKVGEHFKKCV